MIFITEERDDDGFVQCLFLGAFYFLHQHLIDDVFLARAGNSHRAKNLSLFLAGPRPCLRV